ncbi:GNAT family N-acetyltransferase [Stakelama tenebrarum]|uniref:GNAT family N-acetyltransferase n=1 Tax=Stakelama tenebrarum TaxID=2711215 RepID=A0A6G6Y2S6_9SPHN|nr:GNAT family N-acetyltransferase [Sphingosinithalassobacter tenebrarum]QIG79018.1 GNAT family N-acetyltransferase [Sphingosinithalassobacter tenebrarum]
MSTALNITRLRAGGIGDVSTVAAIMAEAFDPRFGEAWTAAQCMGMFSLPGVWLTLAERDATVAGFALSRIAADESELLLLATLPRMRRMGIGGILLRSVIAEARSRGASNLHLEVRAGNDAEHLYRTEGFSKIGERRNYYRGKTGESFDAQTFSRSLI